MWPEIHWGKTALNCHMGSWRKPLTTYWHMQGAENWLAALTIGWHAFLALSIVHC